MLGSVFGRFVHENRWTVRVRSVTSKITMNSLDLATGILQQTQTDWPVNEAVHEASASTSASAAATAMATAVVAVDYNAMIMIDN